MPSPYTNPYLSARPKPNYLPQLNNRFNQRDFSYLNTPPPNVNTTAANNLGSGIVDGAMTGLKDTGGGDGFNWGGAITAGATGLSMIGDAYGMANQELGLGDAPTQQYSATGQPIYSGSYYNSVQAAKPQGATVGEVGGSIAKGAGAGAAVGGLPGAAIGAAFGLATSLIGGRRRRKKQEDEITKAAREARASQKSFNLADKQFDDQQIAQYDYLNRLNNTSRLNNLYSYNV